MRISYITDQIYLHGGAEKILIQKLNYWADVFVADVLLITMQQNGKPSVFRLSEKVQHVDLGFSKSNNLVKKYDDYIKLKDTVNSFNPDAVFLISLDGIRYVLPFLIRKHAVYNEYHTSYYGFYVGYRKLPLLKKIKKQFSYAAIRFVESFFYTKIIFLNQQEFDHYKRKNAAIIPNFFDEIKLPPGADKKQQIITLGRLSYQKGYDMLIDAWEMIHLETKGWTLEIYGNGDHHSKLKQQIENKNLQDSVHLNPAIDSVNEKLSESAYYVMSSRFETFPMVLLEAMSNKLPVVSFDCPTGPSSMLTDGEDSILVKADDVKALAEKMLLLINNEALRTEMGRKALINAERFNSERVMNLWKELVRKHKK